jgi:hypothetical protein
MTVYSRTFKEAKDLFWREFSDEIGVGFRRIEIL